jgi:dihydroxyacid dehydratase/phosphogluconate dehydratase
LDAFDPQRTVHARLSFPIHDGIAMGHDGMLYNLPSREE